MMYADAADDSAENWMALYTPLLRSLALRMMYRFDASLLQELMQAGFIGLILARDRFDPSRCVQFTTYAVPWILGEMKRALRNAVMSDQNAAAVLTPHEESSLSRHCHHKQSNGVAALSYTDITPDYEQLRDALSRLPEDEQRLILLRYYRDLTQKETASLLCRSQSWISKAEQRALNRMRAFMKEAE